MAVPRYLLTNAAFAHGQKSLSGNRAIRALWDIKEFGKASVWARTTSIAGLAYYPNGWFIGPKGAFLVELPLVSSAVFLHHCEGVLWLRHALDVFGVHGVGGFLVPSCSASSATHGRFQRRPYA